MREKTLFRRTTGKRSNFTERICQCVIYPIQNYVFNEPSSTSQESCNYFILESIKDGTAVSSKYNDVMRFKIPNAVVVFSNHMPNTRELSNDRWKIFRIVNAGLQDITIQVWKINNMEI